jgi:O-antigen/teichoic acid export membrane protein
LALGFLSTVVLARFLGASGLGIYAWAYALTAALQILGALGMDRLATREIAGAVARGSWDRAASFLYVAPRAAACGSVALAALTAGVCALTLPSERLAPALIALAFLPALALTSVRLGVLVGLGHVATSRLPDDLLRPLLFTVALTVGWQLGLVPETASVAIAIQAVAVVAALLAGGFMLRRALPREIRAARASPRYRAELREALPLMLVNGAAITLTQIDLILVGAICAPREAGIYALATRIGQVVGLAEYAVNVAFMPVVARLYAQEDLPRLQRGAARVAGSGFLLAAVVAVPVAAFAPQLVSLFGTSFDDAATPLRLVALSFLISAAAGQNGTILAMTGRTRAVLNGSAVALVSNVALNAVMIPLWQVNGAAVAWVLSVIIWNAVLAWEVRRTLGIHASLLGLLGRRALPA